MTVLSSSGIVNGLKNDRLKTPVLRNDIDIMQIKMYTKGHCSFCFAAKNLLIKRGLDYEEISLLNNSSAEKEMRELTGGFTVPQIVIDGKAIGGFAELVELDMDGDL